MLVGAVMLMANGACTKDYNELIVGGWRVNKIIDADHGNNTVDEGFVRRYTFKDDGLATITKEYENGSISQQAVAWNIRNERVSFIYVGDTAVTEWWTIKKLDKSSMEWYGELTGVGEVRMKMDKL